MATAPPTRQPRDSFGHKVDRFWARVTEGMQLSELWSQFRTDARSSYRLYSKDVDSTRAAGESRFRHGMNLVGRFFWAIIEKLTPARRVLLLIALVLIVIPSGDATWQSSSGEVRVIGFDTHFYGGSADVRAAHPRGRRPRGDEARPADRQGNSGVATARRSAADSRHRDRLHHQARQHRRRRLLRRRSRVPASRRIRPTSSPSPTWPERAFPRPC